MKGKTLVMLGGAKTTTNIIYNSLKDDFKIDKVIIEQPPSRAGIIRRRVKKLGLFKVFGQILFRVTVVPFLKLSSRKRSSELKERFKFDDSPIDEDKVVRVASINSDQTMRSLRKIQPDVVFVTGTRIIAKRIINCVPAKFINIHVGITPLYRGVHGAYWALVENNRKVCGVTVHLIDAGIDTGGIVGQAIIAPEKEDNLTTYEMHQLNAGMPLLRKALRDACEDAIIIKPPPEGPSKLWSHPTLWEYIWFRFRLGVK